MKTILFLCTGNYYRSRFAEIYFNWRVGQYGLSWTADSRGLALDPYNRGPLSRHTVAWLTDRGVPLAAYQRLPRDVTQDDLEAASHVVAVKRTEHEPLIQARFPLWLNRVEFWEVHDLDCAGPEDAIPHLEREVIRLLERFATQSRG